MAKPRFKWKAKDLFLLYDLYAGGMTDNEVADTFSMPLSTFIKRRDDHPGAAAAVKYGRKKYKQERDKKEDFDDLVIGRLPPELKEIWNRIKKERSNPTGPQPIQHMEMRHKQVLWVHAWVKNRFNARKACEFLQLPYRVVQLWKEQPQFKKLMDGMMDVKKDFVEDSLMSLIHARNPLATVFAAKTLLRDRGYGEKTEVVGSVQHNHNHEHVLNIDLSQLDLPVNIMMQVMDAIEKKRKQDEAPKPLILEHRDGSEVI
jgi:hypothetical protein